MSLTFQSLPNELKEKILSYTNPSTLSSFGQTSLLSRQYVNNNKKFFNKVFYSYRTIKLTFNNKKEFDENNIVKKFNLTYIIDIDAFFKKEILLTIEGMVRLDDGIYYYNDLIKIKVIYFYHFDYFENTLNLTIPFVNNKMNGIYFLTVEKSYPNQKKLYSVLLAIPYCDDIKENIYIEIFSTIIIIYNGKFRYIYEDDLLKNKTLSELYNNLSFLNLKEYDLLSNSSNQKDLLGVCDIMLSPSSQSNIELDNIGNFALIDKSVFRDNIVTEHETMLSSTTRSYNLIDFAINEHIFVFTSENNFYKLTKIEKTTKDNSKIRVFDHKYSYYFFSTINSIDLSDLNIEYQSNTVNILNYTIYFRHDISYGWNVENFIYLKDNVYYKYNSSSSRTSDSRISFTKSLDNIAQSSNRPVADLNVRAGCL